MSQSVATVVFLLCIVGVLMLAFSPGDHTSTYAIMLTVVTLYTKAAADRSQSHEEHTETAQKVDTIHEIVSNGKGDDKH